MIGIGPGPFKSRILATIGLSIAIGMILLVACGPVAPAAPETVAPTQSPAPTLPSTTPTAAVEPGVVTTPIPTASSVPPTELPVPATSTTVGPPTPTALSTTTIPTSTARPASPTAGNPVAASPTRVSSAPKALASGHPVIINANLFPALDQSKIKPGDIFKGQAVRFGAPEVPLSRATFLKGVSELNTISPSDTQRLGLSKEIVFSSIQDLQTYLSDPQFPGDVDYVEYDFEGVMTPGGEYGNPVGSVTQFADIAHSNGKKVTFAPLVSILGKLQTDGGLTTILSKVDVVSYQGQKQLPNLGPAGFTAKVQSLHSLVTGTHARLAVQLWTTTNGCDTIVSTFNSSLSTIDVMGIGTHDDGPGANCVLTAIRR